ncbi:N-acetyltransferase [Limnothrix sp. FACHB-1083]|uniref:GNAT family N-acetyltransferase n=1 Tax=unclassified Limnothrix TaxID=2632864 RepID=UPI00168083F9|nr:MULTISPECIES: GNAT family N-acetyltransferase [unclassified Limnothrix]MBD2160633.1 N-acetyltransferase [Limnothrix sp. FACHB-1083]MBD2191523.1 N-acetyltransferase [Limnothrix sp. FACHB-1088]
MAQTATTEQIAYELSWVSRMADLSPQEWDALAKPLKTPFLEWAWLNNLETSGSAIPQEGWLPSHLVVRRSGKLVAAAPLYLKGHSYGEFVFDQQWADLSYRLGVDYYPKLLGMTPFTPAEGYRFLIDSAEDERAITEMMLGAIDHFCSRHHVSGCHFLFVDPQWQQLMESLGDFITWKHHSYIWTSNNYQTFEDYLASFNANQRRNIKRERKSMVNSGLEFKTWQGSQIPHGYFSKVYDFYSSTCEKFWGGSQYLTRKFFVDLADQLADRVVLFTAHAHGDDRHPIALSFCITKGDRLYGRYWGCTREIDHLHFNACYYEPIDWAIAHGIQLFDPGAGGQHKRRRGFPATPNHSLHRLYHPRLDRILRTYIDEINQYEQQQIDTINAELPFSQAQPELKL